MCAQTERIEVKGRKKGIATKEHKETQITRTQKNNFYKNSLTNLRTQDKEC